jgi:CubicO group peptidase (beta-lactamase class C family)
MRSVQPCLASLLLFTASLAPVPVAAAPRPPPPLADIDALVARAMNEFSVPGVSVAVVKDGRVVLARGYGVRRMGEPATVDADTVFSIASNTKAFTCSALSVLAQDGKLDWDDPVNRHLPAFQMYDPWVTRQVTVRDLVTHRSGLGEGQGDLMVFPSTSVTRSEIVQGIRFLKPASSFRSQFGYSNVMYVVAGEVVAAASGRSWNEFVEARLIAPLGMTRTSTWSATSLDNVAAPHANVKGALVPMEQGTYDNVGPAGSIRSSAADMARWVKMLLECSRKTVPAGETCPLDAASIQRMWTVQMALQPGEPPEGLEVLKASFSGYGLGLGMRDYRGRKLVGHTGGLPGFVSQVTLVPEERLGIVVLTNQEAEGAFGAVTQGVLDAYLGTPTPPVDWVVAFRNAAEAERKKAAEAVAKAVAARDAASRPGLPLARYAGRYRDPWYGDVTIQEEKGGLVLSMTRTPGMVADLDHWQQDTFVTRWRSLSSLDLSQAEAYVTFALRPDASVERVTLAPVSPATDFSFDFRDLELTPVPTEPGAAKTP